MLTILSRLNKLNNVPFRQLPFVTQYKEIHFKQNLNAGHSKWANIKHIKALKDGQKSGIFNKYSRQLRLAIQEGGSSDPSLNSTLRAVIDEALKKNMPMATIQNTIKKSDANKLQLKKHIIEVRILNKVYMICILYTDNFAQVKMNLATIVRKANGSFVDASHLFDDMGMISAVVNDSLRAKDETQLEEICTEDAIDCGAEEIEIIDHPSGLVSFTCNPIEINRISRALAEKGYTIDDSGHIFVPKSYVNLTEKENKLYDTFMYKLQQFDGIEDVFDNLQPIEEE